jgi:hypothetical protein
MENLQGLYRHRPARTRGLPFALAVLLSVLLWVAALALLVALLS